MYYFFLRYFKDTRCKETSTLTDGHYILETSKGELPGIINKPIYKIRGDIYGWKYNFKSNRKIDELFKTVSFILSKYLLAFQMWGNVSQ